MNFWKTSQGPLTPPPQWANSGGQAMQLKWLVDYKDPIDAWFQQISLTNSPHLWTLSSYLKMYILNVKLKKLGTSDYQIPKMNHPSFILECTTRAPSSGEKANKFASQIKQFFLWHLLWHSIWHCWKWGNHKIQMQSNQMLDPKWMMQYVIKHKGCRQMVLKAKKSDVTYFEKMIFHFWQKTFSVPACLLSCLTFLGILRFLIAWPVSP